MSRVDRRVSIGDSELWRDCVDRRVTGGDLRRGRAERCISDGDGELRRDRVDRRASDGDLQRD